MVQPHAQDPSRPDTFMVGENLQYLKLCVQDMHFRASGAIKSIWILDIASYHHDNLSVMIIDILIVNLVSIVNSLMKSDFLEQNRNPFELDIAPS